MPFSSGASIDKRRLIALVRENPILWDARLPHYRRSDQHKAHKWEELGRQFGVSGERVQRIFTTLREEFRRELNREKRLAHAAAKSNWVYFEAMSFLKQVIRQRNNRGRARGLAKCAPQPVAKNNNHNHNHNNSSSSSSSSSSHSSKNNKCSSEADVADDVAVAVGGDTVEHAFIKKHNNVDIIDEYQYFAPNHPNNPNNPNNPSNQAMTLPHQLLDPLLHLQAELQLSEQQQQQQQNQHQQHHHHHHHHLRHGGGTVSELAAQLQREVMYIKFGEFVAARLNNLSESAAKDMMNQILRMITY